MATPPACRHKNDLDRSQNGSVLGSFSYLIHEGPSPIGTVKILRAPLRVEAFSVFADIFYLFAEHVHAVFTPFWLEYLTILIHLPLIQRGGQDARKREAGARETQ